MIHILISYIVYWILAAVGITLGYHRYFSHGIFKTNPYHSFIEVILLYCGLLCGGQSPLSWSGVHRMHHAYVDTELDPHSPKYKKWWQILFSTGKIKNIPRKFIRDLYNNPRIVFFHKYGKIILIYTYLFAVWINPIILYYLIMTFILSYLFYGMLNLLAHDDNGAVNKWWINLFAPFEGNHYDHHHKR